MKAMTPHTTFYDQYFRCEDVLKNIYNQTKGKIMFYHYGGRSPRTSCSYDKVVACIYHGIILLPDWPGNSQDLNLIENVWFQMKNELSDERPTSEEGVKKIVSRVWKKISLNYLLQLFESMLRHRQAVINAAGGHTKY